jgi:hypothetical protein
VPVGTGSIGTPPLHNGLEIDRARDGQIASIR